MYRHKASYYLVEKGLNMSDGLDIINPDLTASKPKVTNQLDAIGADAKIDAFPKFLSEMIFVDGYNSRDTFDISYATYAWFLIYSEALRLSKQAR